MSERRLKIRCCVSYRRIRNSQQEFSSSVELIEELEELESRTDFDIRIEMGLKKLDIKPSEYLLKFYIFLN